MESAAKEWGRNIRSARRALGLTQTQLAHRCGYRQTTISDIECGTHPLPADVCLRIATALGAEPSVLFAWPKAVQA